MEGDLKDTEDKFMWRLHVRIRNLSDVQQKLSGGERKQNNSLNIHACTSSNASTYSSNASTYSSDASMYLCSVIRHTGHSDA